MHPGCPHVGCGADPVSRPYIAAGVMLVLGTVAVILMMVSSALSVNELEPQEFVVVVPEVSTSSTTTTFATTTTVATQILEPIPSTSTPYFECVKWRESRGDYTVSDPTGTFHGAYQIYQGGWDEIATEIGRDDLVGVRPDTATRLDQDIVAWAMFSKYGTKPWGGACQ